MKVQEFMERVGITQTGRAIAYIKDGLEEINMLAETHVMTTRLNLKKGQRFYNLPNNMLKVIDIRCKNQLNSNDEYRSIPRLVGNITNKDSNGV